MNQNEPTTKVRGILQRFATSWAARTSPEPPWPTPSPEVSPLKVRRDSYREGYAAGIAAMLADFERTSAVLREIMQAVDSLPVSAYASLTDAQLVAKVEAWTASNRGDRGDRGGGFYHGAFPIGMVTSWIARAEVAERAVERGRKVADEIAFALGNRQCDGDLAVQMSILRRWLADLRDPDPSADARTEVAGRVERFEQRLALEDALRVIAETHRVLDAAGVPSARGALCIDAACQSKLAHRVRCLVTSRDALYRLEEILTKRAQEAEASREDLARQLTIATEMLEHERAIVRELSQVRGIVESTGGRTLAYVTRPYLDVTVERLAQAIQWGGAATDDSRSFGDWVRFIRYQVSQAIGHHAIAASTRGRFVKIAALAIAAVESIDRRMAQGNGGDSR